jgi:hypothetical protein
VVALVQFDELYVRKEVDRRSNFGARLRDRAPGNVIYCAAGLANFASSTGTLCFTSSNLMSIVKADVT